MKEFLASSLGNRILTGVAILMLSIVGFRYWANRVTPEKIAAGKALFEHQWQPQDPLSPNGDGLGPVFNDVSCVACHFQGGTGGAGPNSKNVHKFTVVPTVERGDVHHGVIHKESIRDELKEDISQVENLFPKIPGRIRSEGCFTVEEPAVSPVLSSSINTPSLFGLGLIEEISSFSISYHGTKKTMSAIANEFQGNFSSAGIGRLRMSGPRVGKFGWKGEFGTIEEFVAEACAVELGLSVPGRRQDLPGAFKEDKSARYDLNSRQLHEMVCFVRSLPRPEQVLPTATDKRQEVFRGQAIFSQVGCTDCHVPNLGGVAGIYSDFHLYKLKKPGSNSYDNLLTNRNVKFPLSEIEPDEWKTPPLWGVADTAPYFHDGSASTLLGAIQLHHGDAEYSRSAFHQLPENDQAALVAFLNTLKAPRSPKPTQLAKNRIPE